MIRVAVDDGRPAISARPWPSTSVGCHVSGVLQVTEPLFVSWTWPIRLPAAPSHIVILVARSAGVQSGRTEGDGVAVGLGVGVGVGLGLGLGAGVGLAIGTATAIDGAGVGVADGNGAPGPDGLARLPSRAKTAI